MNRFQNYIDVRFVCIFMLIGLLTSCDKNKTNDSTIIIPTKTAAALYIGNEGQFQHGDATLTFIDILNNKSNNNAFQSANNRPLGDVLQSINVTKNYIYLVVNNSQKIEVINRDDLKSVATITGFTSPRFIEYINSNLAYVSEFFSTKLRVINPSTNKIVQSIEIGGWQEEIKHFNNELFITDYQNNRVFVLDILTDQITDTIVVAKNPTSLFIDNNNLLWVGCNGDASNKASVYCIDAITHKVLRYISMGNSLLRRITGTKNNSKLYVLCDDVFTINTSDTTLPVTTFINNYGAGHSFYGMSVDSTNNDFYLSDAKNYQQPSTIYHYNKNGDLIGMFNVGINASSFAFYYE